MIVILTLRLFVCRCMSLASASPSAAADVPTNVPFPLIFSQLQRVLFAFLVIFFFFFILKTASICGRLAEPYIFDWSHLFSLSLSLSKSKYFLLQMTNHRCLNLGVDVVVPTSYFLLCIFFYYFERCVHRINEWLAAFFFLLPLLGKWICWIFFLHFFYWQRNILLSKMAVFCVAFLRPFFIEHRPD